MFTNFHCSEFPREFSANFCENSRGAGDRTVSGISVAVIVTVVVSLVCVFAVACVPVVVCMSALSFNFCWRPLVHDVLNVSGLPAFAGIPASDIGVSEVTFILAVAGVPAVAGFLLLLSSLMLLASLPILASLIIEDGIFMYSKVQ